MFMVFLLFVVTGCGGGGGGSAAGGGGTTDTVSGIAAAGAVISGMVYLKDSAATPKELSKAIAVDGSHSFDVTGMTKPYLLKAVGTANGQTYTLYSLVNGSGTANVNPLGSLVVSQAFGGADLATLYGAPTLAALQAAVNNLTTALQTVQTKLQALLLAHGTTTIDPIASAYSANSRGLDGMFDQVRINVSNGTVTITNIGTNAIIFTAATNALANGTVNSSNIPQPLPPANASFETGKHYFFYGSKPESYSETGITGSTYQSIKYTWNGTIWNPVNQGSVAVTVNADGSFTGTNPTTGIPETIWYTLKQNLAGLKIGGMTGELLLDSSKTFTSGAYLLEGHDKPNVDEYHLGLNYNPSPTNFTATTLQQLVDSGYTSMLTVYNAPHAPYFVDVKFVAGNVVNIFSNGVLLGTGSWSYVTVQGESLLLVSIPDSFRNQYTRVGGDPYFVVQNGAIKQGEYRKAGRELMSDPEMYQYNKNAFDQILQNIDTSKL